MITVPTMILCTLAAVHYIFIFNFLCFMLFQTGEYSHCHDNVIVNVQSKLELRKRGNYCGFLLNEQGMLLTKRHAGEKEEGSLGPACLLGGWGFAVLVGC